MDIYRKQSLLMVFRHMKTLHLGDMIKDIISDKNLTQIEVANRMDMSRNGLHSTLNKENMNTDLIRRFSKALDINLWEKIYRETSEQNYSEQFKANENNISEERIDYKNAQSNNESIQITFTVSMDKRNELLRLIAS